MRLRRRSARSRRPRFAAHSQMIDERPAEASARKRIGDFEGDLIVGRHGLSAIGTLVCRATRFVRLVYVPDRRRGEDFAAALATAVGDLPPVARRTLTWDQGSEMARHDLLAHLFDEGIYSLTREVRGNAVPTRTRTACFASTFPRAPTCAPSPSTTCDGSRTFSTTGRATACTGPHRQRLSPLDCHNDHASVATTTRIRPRTQGRLLVNFRPSLTPWKLNRVLRD
ncbi:MAG: IS30 family transposase [Comamonadaceae bacterium]|nr:MAG: IS30 family transposase [Comamonadaceae bacterium]